MTEGFSRIDPELCTGCGNCVETCPSDAITGTRHDVHKISEERCVACGRCVQVCAAYDTIFQERQTTRQERLRQRDLPSGLVEPLFAAYDYSYLSGISAALADPNRTVLVQLGPAVCGPLAEDFGLQPGAVSPGRVIAALRKIGFRKVYDFTFAAALALLEEAHELVDRLRTGKILPVINSSCPAAVKFIEQFHPELIHFLAGSKSPAQIGGTLLKSYLASALNLDPAQIYTVTIGSCTARKFEASREEMNLNGFRNIDAVLTTRELAYLFKAAGIDPLTLPEETYDGELPALTGTENVYCSAGDVTGSVFYAGNALLASQNAEPLKVECEETATEGVRTATVQMGRYAVKAAVVTGLQAALPMLEAMKSGRSDIAFLELLACPAGCVSGGGQPKALLPQAKVPGYARRAELYSGIDAAKIAGITQNPAVKQIYQDFFVKACGDKSNRALHTQYFDRKLSH